MDIAVTSAPVSILNFTMCSPTLMLVNQADSLLVSFVVESRNAVSSPDVLSTDAFLCLVKH